MKFDSIIPASATQPTPAAGNAAREVVDSFIKNTVAGIKNTVTGALDGLSAGIGQLREEQRTVERATDEISRQLLKLEIVATLQQNLQPRFQMWGYFLEPGVAAHPYGKPDYAYTALRRNGTEFALAQLPPRVFATDETGYALYVSEFAKMLKAFRERQTRLFAQGIQGIAFAFRTALEDESKGADWRFIPWDDVIGLQEAKLEFWQAFALAKPSLAPGGGKPALQVKAPSSAQINLIVGVLMRLATNDYSRSEIAFRTLVSRSNWPQEWKQARLAGWEDMAEPDARTFVGYMTAKNTFPAGHELAGQSVLGEFLRSILLSATLGGKDADTLARIVVECALVPDANTYTKYYEL